MPQAMLQQVSYPLGVFHIRLSSGDRFDMLGIDHQQFKTAFQQIKHRFPIHTRCPRSAICVHPCSRSQSESFNNSSVVVK
jgi:hypothetical protein